MEGRGGEDTGSLGNKDLSESGDMSVAEVEGDQAKYTGW